MILVGWIERPGRPAAARGLVDTYASIGGFARTDRTFPLGRDRRLHCVWLQPARSGGAPAPSPGVGRGRGRVVLTATSSESRHIGHHQVREVEVTVEPDGTLVLSVPWVGPEQLYHRWAGGELVFGTDLRLFATAPDAALDEAGVYGLLQYGLVPAPLSLVVGVDRLAPGRRLVLRPDALGTRIEQLPLPLPDVEPHVGAAKAAVTRKLRESLTAVTGDPVVLFSGGVDSALLAAELLDLGRSDTVLLNCSFGPDDPEAAFAREMAGFFGLPFEQVTVSGASVAPMLERIGRDYLAPFGDSSVLPMNTLLREGLPGLSDDAVLVDGSGADTILGSFDQHTPLSRVPGPMRSMLGRLYLASRAYQRPSPTEERLRRAQESRTMSIPHLLTFGEQSAEGLYYRVPAVTVRRLESALADELRVDGRDLGMHGRHVVGNLILLGERVLPKGYGPVVTAGARIAYPFLEPELLGLGLVLPESVKNACGESKLPLKQRLSELIPREWVYRLKSGFTPPLSNLLLHPDVAGLVEDVVLHPGNALLDYCDREVVARLYRRVHEQRPTSKGVLASLWKLVFVSCWWRHQRSAAAAGRAPELLPAYEVSS